MWWRLTRFIVGGMRKSPGLIQPRETLTLPLPTFETWMNHLTNCFHRWHCASGSRNDCFLPSSDGKLLQDLNALHLQITNTVTYRDPGNGSQAIGKGQVYMPHKCPWSKFKVLFFFTHCLDHQYRSAWFDLQQLTLWILFAGHTSVVYDKWEWMIDHRLMKSM